MSALNCEERPQSGPPLKLFTDPGLLRHLHRNLLVRLLEDSKEALLPEAAALLVADLNHEQFCAAWAAQLSSPGALGTPLLEALIAIETLALTENRPLLDDALSHLPPGYEVNRNLPPLNQALHLWLIAQNTPGVIYPILSPSPLSETLSSTLPARHSPGDGGSPASSSKPEQPSTFNPQPSTEFAGEPATCNLQPSTHSASAPRPSTLNPQPSDEFSRLARLSPEEYDHARRAEAKRLHLRLATLDDAVDRARTLEDDAQANAVFLPDLQLWPEPIPDAPALFDQVHDRLLLYLHLPTGAAVVLTLWTPHAHAIAAFTQTPRLNLTSIEPGCGKTTVLNLLATMTPRVMRTDNLKTAVLFRVVDQHQPTLLLDELDSYLHLFPELRGLLNAGNSHGASVYRCEGHAVRAFRAFAATALAGIGHLAPTLRDRSIVISLAKAPPGALQARFDKRHLDIETELGRKIARWAKDNFAAIAACDPVMPSGAYNRLADNWRPLLAIAQIIGGHWPQRALDAFHALNGSSSADHSQPGTSDSAPHAPLSPGERAGVRANSLEQSKIQIQNSKISSGSQLSTINALAQPGIQNQISKIPPNSQPSTINPLSRRSQTEADQLLLAALRSIFAQSGADRLFSSDLVTALRALPDRPNSQPSTLNPQLTPARLARHLSPFGIRPKLFRVSTRRGKGYELADLIPAFNQFLEPA